MRNGPITSTDLDTSEIIQLEDVLGIAPYLKEPQCSHSTTQAGTWIDG